MDLTVQYKDGGIIPYTIFCAAHCHEETLKNYPYYATQQKNDKPGWVITP